LIFRYIVAALVCTETQTHTHRRNGTLKIMARQTQSKLCPLRGWMQPQVMRGWGIGT